MKKELKISLIVLLVFLVIIAVVVAITLAYWQFKYLEFKSNVLGKTSAEVEELYGRFDGTGMRRCEDGMFRNSSCYYIVIEERVGFLGTEPPYIMVVRFDHNAVARSVSFEQGGWGG